MKILHTGDLHLDSPFCSSNTLEADSRRAEQTDVLRRIFALAKDEACDLILIAGDLFDGRYVTPETEEKVIELFGSVTCPVVISPGNHDPYVNGSIYKNTRLPENVYVFSSNEVQCFDFDGLKTRVYGFAFTSASLNVSPLAVGQSARGDGYINLLCAHADLSSPVSRYCPLTVGDIERFGIDYAALGHIHNRAGDDSHTDSVIRYCGFAEGRSFDELGDGGVFLVSFEDGRVSDVERRVVSVQKYEMLELDVTDVEDRAQIESLIKEKIKEIAGEGILHLRVSLVGSFGDGTLPDADGLLSDIGEPLASLEIRDLTVPTRDVSSLSQDVSLRGAFYNALYAGLIDDDPEVRAKTARARERLSLSRTSTPLRAARISTARCSVRALAAMRTTLRHPAPTARGR